MTTPFMLPGGLASVVVVMALKVVLTVPTTVTATMITTEMRAAMSLGLQIALRVGDCGWRRARDSDAIKEMGGERLGRWWRRRGRHTAEA